MSDLPDYAQSVSIDAANVTIPISGAVTIAAGSVTIANASIAVINAAGTKITSARPPKSLGFVFNSPNPHTVNFTLDSDVQALVLNITTLGNGDLTHLKVAWHSGAGASAWLPLELFKFNQAVYVVPITPTALDTNGNPMNSIDVTVAGNTLGDDLVEVVELFESAPLWLEFFAPPFAEPNQLPLVAGIDLGGVALVQFASQWLISPLANVQIALFEIIQGFVQQGVAPMAYLLGHGTALPSGVALAPLASRLAVGSSAAAIGNEFLFEFHGAELSRGDGVWLQNPQPANLQVALFTLNYSLG